MFNFDLEKDIEDFDLVFLDIETTGLDVKETDKICEIAALKVKNRQVIDTFYSLINPQKSMPYQAYLIHKITDSDVKDAPVFESIIERFVDFVKNCIICAYNAEFDISFINYQLKKAFYPEIFLPIIDILAMAKRTIKLSSYKLENVAKFLGISFSGLHRSLDDAKIAKEIFFKLVDILKQKNLSLAEQYLSIFGALDFYKKMQQQKIDALREAITRKMELTIDFFSYDEKLERNLIKPVSIIKENRKIYLWYEDNNKNQKRINVDRIFKIILV